MTNNIEQIRAFHELYKSGVITEEEFEFEKKKFLISKEEKIVAPIKNVSPPREAAPAIVQQSKELEIGVRNSYRWIFIPVGFFALILIWFTIKSLNAKETEPSYTNSSNSNSFHSNSTTSYSQSEQISIDAYRKGYSDGQMAYGLPASETASAYESYLAHGYNFSSADVTVYEMGYNDGMYGRTPEY